MIFVVLRLRSAKTLCLLKAGSKTIWVEKSVRSALREMLSKILRPGLSLLQLLSKLNPRRNESGVNPLATFIDDEKLTFDDVLLVPQYSDVKSRADVNLKTEVGGWCLNHPIIPANMDTITGLEMAMTVGYTGGMGILHRFQSVENVLASLKELKAHGRPAVPSVGVDGLVAAEVYREFTDVICVDVAHGHSLQVGEFVKVLRKKLGYTIIAGNVCTATGAIYLRECGAHTIKVGCGNGSICATRGVTGHGYPQLSAILDVASKASEYGYKIIADGGLSSSGDIVKALAAGADAVMTGYLFAGCPETPGGGVYRGMASAQAQMDHKGRVSNNTPEGVSFKVSVKPPASEIIKQLCGGIRSGLSYSGVKNLKELRENAVFARVSKNTVVENSTRKPT